MPAASESITEKQLSRLKLLRRFIDLLDKHGAQIVPQRREVHGLRDLDRSTYFGLFDELDGLGCGYVLRLQNTVKWEVIESHPLSPEAIALGVTLDATVRLGHRGGPGQYNNIL